MQKNIALLFGLEFFRDAYYSGIFLLLPFISKELHLTLTQSGSLQSFMYIVGFFVSVILGYLIPRFSGMKLLIPCLLMFSFASFGLFFANNYATVLIGFFFAGVGFCLYASFAHGMFSKFVDKARRGTLLGNMMAVGDIGKVITVSSFAFVITHTGWRMVTLVLGILFFIAFIVYEVMHTNTSIITDQQPKPKITWKYIFSHKDFLYILIISGLDMFANLPLYFLLPFLLFSKGLSPQEVGLITGTYFLGNTMSRLIFGRLVDRYGSAKIFIFSEVVMAGMLIAIVAAQSIPFITLTAILLGLITEASDPATAHMAASVAEKHGSFEQVFATRANVTRAAILVAPFILGFIADHSSIAVSFYTISGVVLLATVPAFLLIRENPKA